MARKYTDYFLESDPPAATEKKFEPQAEVGIELNTSISDKDKNRQLFEKILQGEGMSAQQLFDYVKSNPDSARKIVGKYAPRDNEENFEKNRYSKELITALDQGDYDEITTLYSPAQLPISGIQYKTIDQIRAETAGKYSPIKALLQSQNPVLDKKQQDRLKKIAAINSVGKGLGTILQGYYGKKGATITPDKNELLPQAYQEYMSNIDEYEKKKDLWNKDMLSLSLKEQGDADAMAREQEAYKRADNLAQWKAIIEKQKAEAAAAQAKEMQQANFDFQTELSKSKDVNDIEKLKLAHKNKVEEIAMQYKNKIAEINAYEKAGRYAGKSGKSFYIERAPGEEDSQFVFRTVTGKQVYLDPDQLDIVEDLLQRELMSRTPESMMAKGYLEQIGKDGKTTEAEARFILSRYGEKYYDFIDGKAVPRGTAPNPWKQTIGQPKKEETSNPWPVQQATAAPAKQAVGSEFDKYKRK